MNQTTEKIPHFAEAAWVLGIILCALGICLSTKSGFGVSTTAAPTYILYLKLSQLSPAITYGITEYSVQGILILLLWILFRRFKWKYLLSFGTAILYGLAIDGWYRILGNGIYALLWQRILSCVLGIVITALSIALFLRTYLPQEAYELLVKEIAEHRSLNMTQVKWIYDLCSLLFSIVLMLLLFHRFSFQMIGINTLIVAVVNAPLIGAWGKLLDRVFTFDSLDEPFHAAFNRIMN